MNQITFDYEIVGNLYMTSYHLLSSQQLFLHLNEKESLLFATHFTKSMCL